MSQWKILKYKRSNQLRQTNIMDDIHNSSTILNPSYNNTLQVIIGIMEEKKPAEKTTFKTKLN